MAGSLIVAAAMVLFASAHADWRQDAKEAALKYGDQKKDELVRSKSKAAIMALYKKLYAARKKINPSASRALAEVAIMTPDFEKLAEDAADAYASGDPEKIRAASESVAVKFGEQLARLGSTAKSREMLGSLIGKADKVREISQVLGNATSGTKAGQRAAAEYVGQALIGLTRAAGVIGFYQASVGAMKYVRGEYIDSEVEGLYKRYKNAPDDDARNAIIGEVSWGTGGYKVVIDERRRELEAQKEAAIGDAADIAGDAIREHLTKTTEEEIIASMVASFEGRIAKEKEDKDLEAARAAGEKRVATILTPLKDAYERKNGTQALKENPYNLGLFINQVAASLEGMPELNPDSDRSLTLTSRALSAKLVYGKDSKEYAGAMAALNQERTSAVEENLGGPCVGDAKALALRIWNHGQKLYEAGKAAEALPFFREALAICPSDKHAAQVVTLAKMLTEPEQGFDGTYVGRGSHGAPGSAQTVFTLRLTVAGERLSGTFTGRFPKANISESAAVTGSVSSDGRITATVTGRHKMSVGASASGSGNDVDSKVGRAVGNVVQMMFNYPFAGQFIGRIAGVKANGSILLRRTTKPLWKSPRNGSWSAARQ